MQRPDRLAQADRSASGRLMDVLRVSQPGRKGGTRAAFVRRGPLPAGLILFWGAVLVLGALLPPLWVKARSRGREDAWFEQALQMADRLTQAFCSVDLGIRSQGPFSLEEDFLRFASHPLNVALVHRKDGRVWVRDADRFVLAPETPEVATFRAWGLMASHSGHGIWCPETWRDPILQQAAYTVITRTGSPLVVLKRWRPGSPEVHRFMEDLTRGWMPIRFGLLKAKRTQEASESFGGHELRALAPGQPFREALPQGRYYSYPWQPFVAPPAGVLAAQARARRQDLTIAWSFYAMAALLSGSVLFSLLGTLQRRAQDAQRLAALAHGLKTPLALLKLRCDSVLNTSLSWDQREASLLRVNDGADQLLELIENGLEPFRPRRGQLPLETLDRRFFEVLAEELEPALEEEQRHLDLHLEVHAFLARAAALHTALSILLENALIHGRGRIAMRVRRVRGLVEISISDEGDGIPEEKLTSMLIRGNLSESKPEAIRSSQGLGLYLLASLALRESWGLSFLRDPGRSFTVCLELPVPRHAARPRPQGALDTSAQA